MKNEKILKIVVAHPQKQGSYLLSSSLFRSGLLNKYITSFYYKPFTLAHLIHFFSGAKSKERIEDRKITYLPNHNVKVVCQLTSFKAMLYNRKGKRTKFLKTNEKLNQTFGKVVANYCKKNKIDIVFSSVKNSSMLFKKTKTSSCINVLEFSSNAPQYALSIYEKDVALFPDSTLKNEINDYYIGHSDEYKNADAFLCPSKITAKSAVFCGADPKNIFIVKWYFSNKNYTYTNHSFKKRNNTILKIVYTGNITAMKGIHHLCNVASFLASEVELFLIGTSDCAFQNQYEHYKNIHFLGKKNQSEINKFLKECDLFVFPSLADAVGMSAIEAMYAGLPVLSSIYAGVSDYITDGINGFIFDPINEEEFKEKLIVIKQILSKDSGKISELAHSAIEAYTQDSYDKEIKKIILKLKEDRVR